MLSPIAGKPTEGLKGRGAPRKGRQFPDSDMCIKSASGYAEELWPSSNIHVTQLSIG